MAKAGTSHDISFYNAATADDMGFMLQRDPKTGTPIYLKTTDPALAQQFFTGNPDYGKTPAEKEVRKVQSDFRGGFGLEYEDGTSRYHYGVNIDARFRDEVRLGSQVVPVVKMALPALVYAGPSPLQSPVGGTATQNTDATNWDNAWRSRFVYVRVNATYTVLSGSATASVSVSDGVSTLATVNYSSSTTIAFAAGVMLGAAATHLRVTLSVIGGGGGEGRLSGISITLGGYGACNAQCDFNGKRYFAFGHALMELNATGDGLLPGGIFKEAITALLPYNVAGTDYLFVMQGWSSAYYYLTTALAATLSTLAENTLAHMASNGVNWYGSDTNSTIVTTTNPINGGVDWGSSKQVGEDVYDISDLIFFEDLLHIRKNDRPYYFDGTDVFPLTDETVNMGTASDGTRFFVWHGALYMSYGEQGLLEYNGVSLTWRSPALSNMNAADFVGRVQAVAGDDLFLYVTLDNGTKVEVMAGRVDYVDGADRWCWHSLSEITITDCASAGISAVFKKRMWIASDTGTENLFYLPVTTKYGAISEDADYTYQTGGYLVTPGYHFNFRADKKAFIRVDIEQAGTTASVYWNVYYRKLGDTDWTQITLASKTDALTHGYIPADAMGAVPSTSAMWFKIVGVTNSAAASPRLLSFGVAAVWYPPQRELIQCSVVLEEGQLIRNGNETETLHVRQAFLESLYNPATAYPVKFWGLEYDETNTAYYDYKYVKLLPPMKGYPVRADKGRPIQWSYDLTMQVIRVS
jgi:hypothetical protein